MVPSSFLFFFFLRGITTGFAAWPDNDKAVPQVRQLLSGGGWQKTVVND
jgi:hypothetical protein